MEEFHLSVEIVEKMRNEKNVEGLIKALRYQKDWRVQREAAMALGLIEDKKAVKPLI